LISFGILMLSLHPEFFIANGEAIIGVGVVGVFSISK
jgi:hypothetical protein